MDQVSCGPSGWKRMVPRGVVVVWWAAVVPGVAPGGGVAPTVEDAPAARTYPPPEVTARSPQEDPVALLLAPLLDADWSATCTEWASTLVDGVCDERRGPIYGAGADGAWCHRGRQEGEGRATRSFYFYRFDPDGPLGCRLRRVESAVRVDPMILSDLARVPADTLAPADSLALRLHRRAEEELTRRFGPADHPPGTGLGESGSARWEEVRRWRNSEGTAYLYVNRPIGDGVPTLGLVAVHQELLELRPEHDRLSTWRCCGPPSLDSALSDVLEALGVPIALRASPGVPDSPTPTRVAQEVLRVLDRAEDAAPGERRASLLLAADHLARWLTWHLPSSMSLPPGLRATRDVLATRGVELEWNPLGGAWQSTRGLLWRTWREHPETPWGELAFVHLLEHGWWTGVGCPGGGATEAAFRDVIREGERFLEERGGGEHRLLVTFHLAQAYETWWSVSLAPPDDTYVMDPNVYGEGSEGARQTAVALYRTVREEESGSDRARYAALRLPRLEMGIDTGQRRFYCIFD